MGFRRCVVRFVLSFCVVVGLSGCSKDVDYTPPAGSSEMAITHYSYDKIIIDGETYDIDLMIRPDGKILSWNFDRDGHRVKPDDIRNYMSDEVKTVILGMGYNGEGFLDEDAVAYAKELEANGIAVHVLETSEAVNLFNASPKEGLLALIHIRY